MESKALPQMHFLNDVTGIDHRVTFASVAFTFGIYLYFFHKASRGSFNLITAIPCFLTRQQLGKKSQTEDVIRMHCEQRQVLQTFLVQKCSFLPDNDTCRTIFRYLSASGYVRVPQKDFIDFIVQAAKSQKRKKRAHLYTKTHYNGTQYVLTSRNPSIMKINKL